jgi:hypothetical protein
MSFDFAHIALRSCCPAPTGRRPGWVIANSLRFAVLAFEREQLCILALDFRDSQIKIRILSHAAVTVLECFVT